MNWYLLSCYILAGIIFVFAGPAAKDFCDERLKNNFDPMIHIFQKLAFTVIIAAGIIFFWPILVPSAWNAQKKRSPFKDIIDLNDILSHTNKDQLDADEFPNGVGDFGSLSNPIPCKSILDSSCYLNSLTANDGKLITFERIGSFGSEICQFPIDGYEIKVDSKRVTTLYISPYQRRNSQKVPDGFELRGPLYT